MAGGTNVEKKDIGMSQNIKNKDDLTPKIA